MSTTSNVKRWAEYVLSEYEGATGSQPSDDIILVQEVGGVVMTARDLRSLAGYSDYVEIPRKSFRIARVLSSVIDRVAGLLYTSYFAAVARIGNRARVHGPLRTVGEYTPYPPVSGYYLMKVSYPEYREGELYLPSSASWVVAFVDVRGAGEPTVTGAGGTVSWKDVLVINPYPLEN